MQNVDIAANREKRALDNDKLMTKRLLQGVQNNIAQELLGDMGKDIDNVLSGKVKVKLSWRERMAYKIKFWLNKLFKTF